MKTVCMRILQATCLFLLCHTSLALPSNCFKLQASMGDWVSEIVITNHCGASVDLQKAILEFHSNQKVTGHYWGDFGDLAYPEKTSIISEVASAGYLIKMPLIFPEGGGGWEPKTTLDSNGTIKLQFSTTPELIINNLAFYPMSEPEKKESRIQFNLPANPTNENIAPEITVTNHNDYKTTIRNAPWSGYYELSKIPFGQYDILITSIKTKENTWSGTANPSHVSLNNASGANVDIHYQKTINQGNVTIHLPEPAPETDLGSPVLSIKNESTGQMLPEQPLDWAQSNTIRDLNAGEKYLFNSTTLQGKNHSYTPKFTPSELITINANETVDLTLTYQANVLETETVRAHATGLPANAKPKLHVQDNHGHVYPFTINHEAEGQVSLPINRQYHIKAEAITVQDRRYVPNVTPKGFILEKGQTVAISIEYQKEEQRTTKFSPYVDVTLGSITRWDNHTSSMQPVGLLDIVNDSGIKSFHLAFVTGQHDNEGCRGTWAGYPVSTDKAGFGVPVFKQLKEQGVSLTVAFGGLTGQYLAQVCDSETSLTAAYEEVIHAYDPDVLDFDIENNMQTNNEQLDRMMQVIKSLQSKYPDKKISFTLPVLPSGLVKGVGENVIKRAARNGLKDFSLNIMAMDYGASFQDKTMGEYAIEAATNAFKQLKALYPNQSDQMLWHRMEVTPMIGLNDTLPLNFSLADVSTLKYFAQEKGIGLLSYWSITRDHPCDKDYVSITCSSNNPETGLPNQKDHYEYAKKFMNH